MEIATQTAAPIPTISAKDGASISSDFETFLKMLTAQMENQDPLNPMDSQDFATQLATFSGVEQQVKTNDLLTSLTSQMATASLGDKASWVGMEARLSGDISFAGTPIELYPTPPGLSDRAELVVKNANGEIVQRLNTPLSDEPISWAGVGEDGTPLPGGVYSFSVVGFSNNEAVGETTPESFARLTEIRAENGQVMVITESGAKYPTEAVKGLR